ncbi:hypothetical protein SARC_12307 [Sphaeroforma arctica JP610]|uniref:Uncharacterized protein n=1 Tax=Sphaeroforma arctica JP610 TaxID=667725 RepID=A0A0L0FEH2_9EUKA|nr:hypothetical protein SARC_12307 [Sphaeroforma arctica JP610]KNC75159.1 hypothetical protein SARC_12307 [Sphaeroforma arctica JP610]|eukprot:XP_014149061.1 hypothetical protein SARC_12307 [Sphaeroforma arctica JP610]
MSLFGGMSLVCAIFSLLLPETAGTQFDLNLTSMVKRLYEIDYNPVTRTAPRQDVEGYQPLTRNSTDDMSFDL